MGVLSNKISRDELKPGDHIYSWRHAYIYAHHGIYVGEGKVIHFTQGGGQEIGTEAFLNRVIVSSSSLHDIGNPCPQCGDQSRPDGVISSCIDCFLAGGHLYLYEYGVSRFFFLAKVRGGTCTRASSDSPETVLHRAYYLLKEGFGVYNVSKNNCEDFAIYCKTGRIVITTTDVGRSGQTTSFQALADAFISSSKKYLAVRSRGLATVACVGLAAVDCGVNYCVSRLNSDIGVRSDAVIVPVEELCILFPYTGKVSKED